MDVVQGTMPSPTGKPRRWGRDGVARILEHFLSSRHVSQRQFAAARGVPRTTLQHWLNRKKSLDLEPALSDFLESPTGLAFAHRLVVAAHLIFTNVGPCGIRLVCQFLELSLLDRVVASSYGAQAEMAQAIQDSILAFSTQELARLAPEMPAKQITVCEDETFHPDICLVGIEPVSDFILLEVYAENRTAATWNTLMQDALQGFKVEVIQATSDEASGLLNHARDGLNAHHSPDLFHVQHELTRATCGPVAVQISNAERVIQQRKKVTEKVEVLREACLAQCPEGVGCVDFQVQLAQTEVRKAEEVKQQCELQQQQLRQAIRGLGEDYHPIDLQTGLPQTAEQVEAKLQTRFRAIEELTKKIGCWETAKKHIHKARCVLPKMISTLVFFWNLVGAKMASLKLAKDQEAAFQEHLLPYHYLTIAAAKIEIADTRRALLSLAATLMEKIRAGPLQRLPIEQREAVNRMALECAQIFQRSSSCVEGRNGQLALRHHSLHRLSDRKLSVLTALHNYFIERDDGTTAAERFFGQPPRKLFEWLLEEVRLPSRSAASRN